MSLTNDDVVQILKLIDECGYDDVRVEIGDLKIHVSKHGGAAEVAPSRVPDPIAQQSKVTAPATLAATSRVAPAAAPVPDLEAGVIAIRAPMLGTFFRSPAPGEPPFVEVGARVNADDTVCLLEVMKLFNSVKAGVDGVVQSICVENGAMVEYDQVLVTIKPL
jgi:acetyl-CoA carboxylase biotin carboxyl carrier protein